MKRVLGVISLVLGTSILGWVGYNLFVEIQPEAQGRNPLPAIVVSGAMIWVGIMWVQGKQAG